MVRPCTQLNNTAVLPVRGSDPSLWDPAKQTAKFLLSPYENVEPIPRQNANSHCGGKVEIYEKKKKRW